MEVYLTEQEQIEQLKKIWREYGKLTLCTIAIILIAIFGWRSYSRYENQTAVNASVIYENLYSAVLAHDNNAVTANAQLLMTKYQSLPYAADAALMLAKLNVDQNNLPAAADNLQWVLKHAKNNSIRQVARLRLARILIAQKQPAQALALLDTIDNSAYIGAIDFVKGDALLAQAKKQEAQEQYRLALQVLPQNSVITPIVTMKYESLATPQDMVVKTVAQPNNKQ